MLKLKGVDQMIAKLKKHQLIREGRVAQTKRNLVKAVYTDLVTGSPQWSGNLASNWFIEFHGMVGSYQPIETYSETDWRRDDPYHLGDDPAVSNALARELPKISQIRWNTKIQIVNYAPYASQVEAGQGPNGRDLRPENYLYGQIAMVSYVMMKYKALRTLKRRL